VSCYEAGREGFWLHRYVLAQGIENHVVDSSSIEVNRRRRRRKSDGLDVRSLLRQLCRHVGGERDVWSVVHVPSREPEDRRWLHREIETLTNERTARSNRIHSLLATQGLRLSLNSEFPPRLRDARLWDGSPLPPELRARLEREWVRLQSVREEIDALEAERKVTNRCVPQPIREAFRGGDGSPLHPAGVRGGSHLFFPRGRDGSGSLPFPYRFCTGSDGG
jgi:transposase